MADADSLLNIKANYNNSLSYYLGEISKIPLLTREQEEDLATRARDGEQLAKDKLVRANLRFVVAIAKKYRHHGVPLADLINEGNIGLLMAIEKFDVTMGYHFISYAVWWIRQAILKAICEKSRMIRLPLNRANDLVQIEKVRKRLEKDTGETPPVEQIAEELDMTPQLVKHLIEISKDIISLESPVYDNTDTTNLSDFIQDDKYSSPESKIEQESLSSLINSILDTLTQKEKDIIEHRFGLNGFQAMSLKAIGKKYSLTKERIRQIEKKALSRLRRSSRSSKLKNFIQD
jgi:RNA polymerase primary sigma factor